MMRTTIPEIDLHVMGVFLMSKEEGLDKYSNLLNTRSFSTQILGLSKGVTIVP